MRSHTYDFSAGEFARTFAPMLAVVFGLAFAVRLADLSGGLPKPPNSIRGDEVVFRHQAEASLGRHPAEIVLLGDSTCLAGVDTLQLTRELPTHPSVINLALIIGIDLATYAQTAADFAKTNPGQVRWVILLVCPEKLTGNVESQSEINLWRQIREETRGVVVAPSLSNNGDWFGGRIFRERLGCRLLPDVWRGRGAAFFGFTAELDKYMTAHNGSLIDRGESTAQAQIYPVEWTLPPKFEEASRAFRSHLSPGTKLAIGLTPLPSLTAPAEARRHQLAGLHQWNTWMQADLILTNLPSVLPTSYFARGAHLNPLGQKAFTSALAKELSLRP